MHELNLIPTYRRVAKSHRARRRAWTAVLGTVATVLFVACAVVHVTWGRNSRALDRELADASTTVKAHEAEIATLRRKISDLQARRASAKALSDQPDWSILLAALAGTVGDETALREVSLLPETPPPPAPAAQEAQQSSAAPSANSADNHNNFKANSAKPAAATQPKLKHYIVAVNGLGRSQMAVSRFVLRLQATGLFDDVKLVRTGRDSSAPPIPVAARDGKQQPLPAEAAVTFEVGCTIGDREP